MYKGAPLIGIVGKHLDRPHPTHSASSMIRDEVANAVIQFGGLPIGITLPADPDALSKTEKPATIAHYLELCDGLIFQGGQYIHPDERDIACLAYYRNLPALGFCAGQTIMVQAICSDVAIVDVDVSQHLCPSTNAAHEAIVLPKTLFHSIIQTGNLVVNSRHQRSIASLTHSTLHASALSPEGHAEVIEDSSRRFYLATRFHPESDLNNPYMANIFRAFLRACCYNHTD